jgi:hypothetical protein
MTSTISYIPTYTPTSKSQPTPKPTLTLIPIDTPTNLEETACNHPYFPLRAGNSWTETYTTGFSITRKVNKVIGDMESASAEVDNIGEINNSALTSYTCNQDGISPAVDKNGSYEGIFLPASMLLKDGYSWSYSITNDNYGKLPLKYSFLCQVAGIEKVEWNKQTIEALKIECQVNHTDSDNIQHEYSIIRFFLEGVGEIMWKATEGGHMVVTDYEIH